MSATKQQLGGAFLPPHIITFEGRLYNNDVSERETLDLQLSARVHGFDLEAYCLASYGYGSEWLSRKEQNATLRALIAFKLAKLKSKPEHHHPCPTCKTATVCYREGCKGLGEDECYSCRERLTVFYRNGGAVW